MSTNKHTHIHWFGNDLRISDQPFAEKANQADQFIGVFILDPKRIAYNEWGFRNMSLNRLKALREHLTELERNLAVIGASLIVKYGEAAEIIPRLIEKYQASLSFMNEYATHERLVQEAVLKQIDNVDVVQYDGNFLFDPKHIDWNGTFPHSFSKFRNKAEKHLKRVEYELFPDLKRFDKPQKPNLKASNREIVSNTALPFRGGESSGKERLNDYLFSTKNASRYKETRNELLGADYSTKFSFWLAVGALSPTMIMKELKDYEKGEGANKSTYWIFFELLWRDFFRHAGKFYKDDFFRKSGTLSRSWDCNSNEIAFEEWAQAKTLKAFVNANLIELRATGFMSNRGRQNVASYLVHDQQQDWRRGAAWFEHHLVDYDVYSNHGNWAYVTGVAFNPKGGSQFDIDFQSERYDKNKEYQKKWLK
jgi:deoxyribodipyrimidine photo-lyase